MSISIQFGSETSGAYFPPGIEVQEIFDAHRAVFEENSGIGWRFSGEAVADDYDIEAVMTQAAADLEARGFMVDLVQAQLETGFSASILSANVGVPELLGYEVEFHRDSLIDGGLYADFRRKARINSTVPQIAKRLGGVVLPDEPLLHLAGDVEAADVIQEMHVSPQALEVFNRRGRVTLNCSSMPEYLNTLRQTRAAEDKQDAIFRDLSKTWAQIIGQIPDLARQAQEMTGVSVEHMRQPLNAPYDNRYFTMSLEDVEAAIQAVTAYNL